MADDSYGDDGFEDYDDDFEEDSEAGTPTKPAAAAAPSPAKQRPHTAIAFADVTLGRVLAQGGMGAVYEARHGGQRVAVKMLNSAQISDELIESYRNECQAMMQCAHERVIELYGASLLPPHLFMVMELCGTSLHELLHTTMQRFDNPRRLGIAADVAEGLAYCHKQGVIHRDIKGMNVLVGDDQRAKLIDFGLTATRVTAAGTPAYMAPELLAERPFSKSVDTYALAIT